MPALNEAEGIHDICTRVLGIDAALRDVGIDVLELIVVDDGSTDDTVVLATAIDRVRVVRHITNRGYGAAIKTGFAAASGEILAFLDADGTYPPESLPALCQVLIADAADVAVGSRMVGARNGMPRVRRIGNRFFAALVNLVGPGSITDSASGLRVLKRQALDKLYPLPDGLNFTPVMTTRAAHEDLRVVEVPIQYSERVGRSKLSVLRDGRRFLVTILWTALGYNPSRVLGLVGLASAVTAGAIATGLAAARVGGVTTLGPWGVLAAFATLVLTVAGVSLINLGITFNYLVALFHKKPVRQGLFGRPIVPNLDRAFGWLGLAAMGAGLSMTVTSTWLGLRGWDITRLWLWLLGSALLSLTGLQLCISWILMRVLDELSQRDRLVTAELTELRGRSRPKEVTT